MKTIFTVGAVVLATCLLSGCVNEQKINQLASNVQTLNAKIARLEQDMKALRPQIYAAKSEANRANTRLDAQDYFDCLLAYVRRMIKKSPAAFCYRGYFLTSNRRFRAFLRTSILQARLRRRRFFCRSRRLTLGRHRRMFSQRRTGIAVLAASLTHLFNGWRRH